MYSDLKARFDELNSKADACSVEELHAVLEEALDLAEDALSELLVVELSASKTLEPLSDFAFVGDEGIK